MLIIAKKISGEARFRASFFSVQFVKFLLICVSFCGLPAFSNIDVVYPKKNGVNIYAKSTFILGNIGKDEAFFVNNEAVPLYNDGAFVKVVPLEYGENNFELKSVDKDGVENVINFVINRPKPVKNLAADGDKEPIVFDKHIFAKVICDNVPLRVAPNNLSKRLSHLYSDTFLIIDGEFQGYYKIFNGTNKPFWIDKRFVKIISDNNIRDIANLSHFNYTRNNKHEYFYFKTDRKLPFVVNDTVDEIEVALYYVNKVPKNLNKYADCVKFKDNVLTFKLRRDKIVGYNFSYDGCNMVLKLKRPLRVDKTSPLKNIVVTIDAGHGGTENGSIGFTRVREADIVLDIAKRLDAILKSNGAKSVLIRTEDVNIDLYKRVEMVNVVNPDFSISIHANALPDGKNPLEKCGTSVYYYDKHSKPFADILKKTMINELETMDDGTNYGNFVLTRIPSTISVLVESAYMINPTDYEKLLNGDFRQQVAQSIADGIKKYLLDY